LELVRAEIVDIAI